LKTYWGNDTTQSLLSEDRYQLYLFLKNDYNTERWPAMLNLVISSASQKNIPGFIVTSVPFETLKNDPPKVFTLMTPLACDAVAIKTAARANPTIFLVKNGIILGKWAHADFENAVKAIQLLPPQPGEAARPEDSMTHEPQPDSTGSSSSSPE